MRLLAFAVGFNNFAGGRGLRSAELIERVRSSGRVREAVSFGATGNLAMDTPVPPSEVETMLEALSGRIWVVVEPFEVQDALQVLADWMRPPQEAGVRWTRGLAIRHRTGKTRPLVGSPRAELGWITDRIVGVCKRDLLNERGRLDRARRQGGWGAISSDLNNQSGGIWTARSSRTLEGLLNRLRLDA